PCPTLLVSTSSFFHRHPHHPHLPSFPTRRSSDLPGRVRLDRVRHPGVRLDPEWGVLGLHQHRRADHVHRGGRRVHPPDRSDDHQDRKSTRLNSSHRTISYAVFCLKKKTTKYTRSW